MTGNSTTGLDFVLKKTAVKDIDTYLSDYADSLVAAEHPFADYMRKLFREKGLKQQDVFLRADLSERYGYRLISEDKRTRQRDYILRLCLAAEFSLQETQRALKLYGMSELYSRIPRDAVLIIAFNRELYDIDQVNDLLSSHNMEPLKASSTPD